VTTAIRFEHVSKVYRLGESRRSLREAIARTGRALVHAQPKDTRDFWALRDVSFEINRGDALGIIGPNGAGKTTSLKLLSKITQPTSGVIHVDGRVSALIELGAGFHPDLTGRENVYLNAAILGLSKGEVDRRFDSIVDFAGLEQFIDTPVKRYSSGMYVRLGFAVAAHVEPDVLLVDEVLAVGDAQFQQKCAERIRELQQRQTTIVFVSHNLYLVRSVCNKGLFIHNGKIHAEGGIEPVIRAYDNWCHQETIKSASIHPEEADALQTEPAITINTVVLNRQNGQAQDALNYSDNVEISVQYVANQPIHRPRLIVRAIRTDNVTCFMIKTDDLELTLDDLETEGTIVLRLEPLQLASGAYFIQVKVGGDLDGLTLGEGRSDWFSVGGPSLSHDDTYGVFVPKVSAVKVIPVQDFSR